MTSSDEETLSDPKYKGKSVSEITFRAQSLSHRSYTDVGLAPFPAMTPRQQQNLTSPSTATFDSMATLVPKSRS